MRRTPLKPMSAKKRREIEARKTIVRARCEFQSAACYGPIDRHEIVRRSQSSTAATDERLIVGLCRCHHELDTYKDEALAAGIRIDPHQWRLCDGDPEREQVLIDAAAVAREAFRRWVA